MVILLYCWPCYHLQGSNSSSINYTEVAVLIPAIHQATDGIATQKVIDHK